jgi:hypothetical protein
MVEVTLVLISASKKESRTDCRRFRQIHIALLIGDLLYAVLGFPTACLYLKRLLIVWSCCSQA